MVLSVITGIPPTLGELDRGTPMGIPAREGDGDGLDFEIDAGDFGAAFLGAAAGALAEFGETNVAVLAEFKAGGDQDGIHVEACLTLELEQHVHGAGIAGAAAENPAAAAKDAAGESLHQARGLLSGDGFHLQRPRDARRSACVALCPVDPHVRYIGARIRSIIAVQESNGICLSLEHDGLVQERRTSRW